MSERSSRGALAVLIALALVAVSCRSQAVVTEGAVVTDGTQGATPTTVGGAAEAQDAETTVTTTPASPTPLASPTAAPPPPAVPGTPQPLVAATPVPAPVPTQPPPPPTTAPLAELIRSVRLDSADCPADVAAAQVSCWVATLPRSVTAPVEGENVQVFVALVDNGDPVGAGPVVYLQGGPGVGSATLAPISVGLSHDVLFVDQRGSGYSEPTLSCPEVDDDWAAQFSDDPQVRARADDELTFLAYEACAQRLRAEGINFDDFNTAAAAVDIELLRLLFGYDQWTLWGSSYGTRLGLTVMREYPDGVRAAVLDSVVPFEVDFFATIPAHAIRAITALDAACDASSCAANNGDFATNLSELVLQLNAEPMVVSAQRAITGESFPFLIDGDELLNMVLNQLYSTRALRSLPRQISRFDSGGAQEIVANYVAQRDPTRFELSIALYHSTWCREEFPFHDPAADDALLRDLLPVYGDSPAAAFGSDGIGRLCASFQVAAAPAIDDQPLTSSIPTLVFAGAFDPITPPAWSAQVAAQLTNSTYVEMPDHAHGMTTLCPGQIRLAFLVDPTGELDTTCAANTDPPVFE